MWDVPPSRWCRETWVCTWCYAVTELGTPDFEVVRSVYMPWDLRWEAAWSDMLPNAGRHAYGYRNQTLCGIEKPDMTGSQFAMWGGNRPQECPDCTAAAHIIDARWPTDRRDYHFRVSVEARPEDEPDDVRPDDELGRLDVRLPKPPTTSITRVLTGPRAAVRPDDGFRQIGDGPAALRLPAF